MTFTEYLCYCGGLFGLWFGTNANQVLNYVMNSRNWTLLKDNLCKLCSLSFKAIRKLMICLLNIVLRLHVNNKIAFQ